MLSRKNARDAVYKLIYEYLFQKKTNENSLAVCLTADYPEAETEYINKVYFGVINHFDSLSELIAKYAKNFTGERIYKPDFAALLVAAYEMKYIPEIPLTVSINEAIELVKLYSTENSGKFVNGILASVYKELDQKQGV